MPTIRKLNPDEITAHKSVKVSPRQQTAQQYDAMLADFAPGEWAEVDLDDGDTASPCATIWRQPPHAVACIWRSTQRRSHRALCHRSRAACASPGTTASCGS